MGFANFALPGAVSFIHRSADFSAKRGHQNFAHDGSSSMIAAHMTKREAMRRLENLALETGHKRNHFVKRALLEFLDRNERLLGNRQTRTNGFSSLDEVSFRLNRLP